jgi:hypothetical protein
MVSNTELLEDERDDSVEQCCEIGECERIGTRTNEQDETFGLYQCKSCRTIYHCYPNRYKPWEMQ